jgi:hypothetical protein
MGQNSVGQLTAQMIIESQQGEESIKKIDGLSKLAVVSLKDLAMQMSKLGPSSGGLYDASGQFKKFADGVNEGTDAVKKHGAAMGDGEQALRGFYREQRLQDRTIRESKDALLGMTFGIMAVTSGFGEGSAQAKKFQTSLITGIAAMQAAEFSAAGLSIAGRNAGGVFGSVAATLGKYSGVIGAVVGLGAGLYMFFSDTKDWAKIAAEQGLKKFSDELDTIAGKVTELTPTVTKFRREANQANLDIVTNELNALKEEEKKFNAAKEADRKKAIEGSHTPPAFGASVADVAFWNNAVSKPVETEEQIKQRTERIAELIARQKELQALVAGPVVTGEKPILTPEEQAAADKKAADERQRRLEEMNKSLVAPLDAIKEMAAFEKSTYESNGQTLDEYVAQLVILQKRVGIGEEYNALQIEINRAEKEHGDKIRQANEEAKRAIDSKVEQYAAQYKLNKISADKAIEELQILRDSTTDVNQRLKIEQQIVDIKNEQIQKGNDQLDQAARIGDILSRSFSKSGDDFIAKLNQALQVAVQIAKLMQDKPNGESAGPLSWIESIVSGVGFLAALNMGSTAGSGSQESSAQSKRYGNYSEADLMSGVRATLKPNRVPPGFLTFAASNGSAGMMQEIRAMRAELRSIVPIVNISNPISLGDGLKIEMPGYNRYEKRKIISDPGK